MISVHNLKKSFGNVQVLKGINIEIRKGECVCIIGPSGSGKSTFLRCLNLLEVPDEGEIIIEGESILEKRKDIDKYRENVGMVFQHFNLFPHLTILENVTLAPIRHKMMTEEQAKAKAMELLNRVGVGDKADNYPAQLSGGQKQRVAIARSLALSPEVMLFDEPTSALDPETTQATLQLLKKINKELGLTIVMITHEMDVVKQICNRVVVMNKGVVVEEGDVLEVFRDPKNEVTQAMLGTALAARTIPASMVERVKKVLNTPGENGRKNHLIRLTFVGSSTTEPVLSRACSKFDLDFNILLGQVDEIQSESYGTLTIVMEGTTENFRQALNYIAERGVRVEELTNVI